MSSKYAQLYTVVDRKFTCKFKHKDNKEKECGYSVEIKPGDSTNSLKWHSENYHGDEEEIKQFFAAKTKRPANEQLQPDSKRQKIELSTPKQSSLLSFSKFLKFFKIINASI